MEQITDLNAFVLMVFGWGVVRAAGAIVALYALLMIIDAIRRVFRYTAGYNGG